MSCPAFPVLAAIWASQARLAGHWEYDRHSTSRQRAFCARPGAGCVRQADRAREGEVVSLSDPHKKDEITTLRVNLRTTGPHDNHTHTHTHTQPARASGGGQRNVQRSLNILSLPAWALRPSDPRRRPWRGGARQHRVWISRRTPHGAFVGERCTRTTASLAPRITNCGCQKLRSGEVKSCARTIYWGT